MSAGRGRRRAYHRKGRTNLKQYALSQLRNVVLLGHAGSGKTSLAEAMLYTAGETDRLGKVADGNTVCDYDAEEIRRKVSISAAVAPLTWQDCKINLIDTPGLFDFEGEALEGLRAAGCAVIAISGKSGVNVGTEKAWKNVVRRQVPRAFFVGKLDEEQADFYKVLETLKSVFGANVCPVVVPADDGNGRCYINLIDMKAWRYDKNGKAAEVPLPDTGHRLQGLVTAISEAVAETDESLFEKYFSGESFTREELVDGIHKGVRECAITPVFCGSAFTLEGIGMLLDSIVSMFPGEDESVIRGVTLPDGSETDLAFAPDGAPAAFVFKTLADPYVGKLSFFKVISGQIRPDSTVVNSRTGQPEKIGKLYLLKGKKQTEAESVGTGDIGAVAKMVSPLTGDTLCAASHPLVLRGIDFPVPCLSMAIFPKSKGDEDKISLGLRRLMEEDPTFRFENNAETKQQIISGLGEQHLDVIVSKLRAKFGVSVDLREPQVPYRETIRKKVKVEGKHKKQTGGHGQYGHVWIEFEPCDSEEMVFAENVFGGSVPRNFFPAVEKGLRECTVHGVLAGFPVVGLKATLVDGSYHPVDSSEMSFKMAAALAYRAGLAQASPVLLEPIGSLRAYVPETMMGDVIGEINKRRGRVLGMERSDEYQVIEAEAPVAEMHSFSTALRSMTQGRGSYTFSFARYEEAPPQVAQAVIEKSRQEQAS